MQDIKDTVIFLPQTLEGTDLVGKEGSSLASISDRVVNALANQFVTLYEVVVGVLWETDGRED